jgi:hypothetical protein
MTAMSNGHQYLVLKACIMPWSKGWISEALFFGKNTTTIFPSFEFRDAEGRCAGQSSSVSIAF